MSGYRPGEEFVVAGSGPKTINDRWRTAKTKPVESRKACSGLLEWLRGTRYGTYFAPPIFVPLTRERLLVIDRPSNCPKPTMALSSDTTYDCISQKTAVIAPRLETAMVGSTAPMVNKSLYFEDRIRDATWALG
jgi:hypothetical protein